MITSYFKVALRNLLKNKTLSFINIVGLIIGMCVCLLLMATGVRELSYDKFHENGDRINALYFTVSQPDGIRHGRTMPMPLTPALKSQVPGIEMITRVQGSGSNVQYAGELFQVGIKYVDAEFLDIFDFPVVMGNLESPLGDVNSAVMTRKVAELMFGDEDPIGKVIYEKSGNLERPYVVTAVTENTPSTSTLRYNILVSIENSPDYEPMSWDNQNHDVYVMLGEQVDREDVLESFKSLVHANFGSSIAQLESEGAQPQQNGELITLNMHPLRQLRFATHISRRSAIPIMFPLGMIGIGLMILFIASFNFINMVLGNAMTRATEIGIRKVLGASQGQIRGQLFGESALIILISTALSLVALSMILPEYNAIFPHPVSMQEPFIWLSLGAALLLVAGIAGGYPAMTMSRHPVVAILRQSFRTRKPGLIRNGLLLFQFVVAALLIGSALLVTQQLDYLRNRPLGYNTEQVISLPIGSELAGDAALKLMRNKLLGHPDIHSISGSDRNLGMGEDGSASTSIMGFQQNGKVARVHWMSVAPYIVETLGLNLISGSTFDPARITDSSRLVIINETLKNALSPSDPLVGTFLNMHPAAEIVGVVSDFNFESLKKEVENVALAIDADFPLRYLFFKVSSANTARTMDFIRDSWQDVAPKSEFLASFLDENVDRQYQEEATLMRIVSISAVIAVLLAAMGLFGISFLVVNQRRKEIGIRKVLGASILAVVRLLGTDFMKPVLMGLLIATPLTWYVIQQWLNGFAYRVDISWLTLAGTAMLAIVIAIGTVSLQSIRLAMANPSDSLRDD